jgi:hypothetical protein
MFSKKKFSFFSFVLFVSVFSLYSGRNRKFKVQRLDLSELHSQNSNEQLSPRSIFNDRNNTSFLIDDTKVVGVGPGGNQTFVFVGEKQREYDSYFKIVYGGEIGRGLSAINSIVVKTDGCGNYYAGQHQDINHNFTAMVDPYIWMYGVVYVYWREWYGEYQPYFILRAPVTYNGHNDYVLEYTFAFNGVCIHRLLRDTMNWEAEEQLTALSGDAVELIRSGSNKLKISITEDYFYNCWDNTERTFRNSPYLPGWENMVDVSTGRDLVIGSIN